MSVKPVLFLGSSKQALLSFPQSVRSRVGHELYLVQEGSEPSDFKPMPGIGAGVFEIRVRSPSGAYRVIYVARFKSAIYVLHAFQKKTQKTALSDLELAAQRFGSIREKP